MAGAKGSSAATLYLVAYNAASFAGWAYVLAQTAAHLAEHGGSLNGLFGRIGLPLIWVQTGAALEVVHALTGLVRSGAFTVLMQVYSRLLLVWGALYLFDYPEVRASYALVLMVVAWSVTECVRYSHYALTLLDINLSALVYLRYTLFYVLYPAGVSGELLELWAVLPHAAEIHPLLKPFLLANMAGYPPVLYSLYTHMIRQRRKILGGAGTAKAGAATKSKKKL
ncbi:hypothetical protein IWQ57_002143 [Coemansia nantahalensis]|uniref:Uncharacterized protein n=1 Tax=Coemansia nantahalensis TaxID=2789366 RepID=A0ACC1K1R5_9FUNG|nr:hypothetical protein IWQ57_002143 [Coemansia nantahalensis]